MPSLSLGAVSEALTTFGLLSAICRDRHGLTRAGQDGSGGLRPRGPPNALTRGDPSIPAPFARAPFAPLGRALICGLRPPGPPTRPLAGAPQSPLRSHAP